VLAQKPLVCRKVGLLMTSTKLCVEFNRRDFSMVSQRDKEELTCSDHLSTDHEEGHTHCGCTRSYWGLNFTTDDGEGIYSFRHFKHFNKYRLNNAFIELTGEITLGSTRAKLS